MLSRYESGPQAFQWNGHESQARVWGLGGREEVFVSLALISGTGELSSSSAVQVWAIFHGRQACALAEA